MNKLKMNSFPNAWDFRNSDIQMSSSDKKFRIEYENLNEIGMGAPLAGSVFIVNENQEKLLINNYSGGPPIWNSENTKVAIPIWTKSKFSGTRQRIAILNVQINKLTIFEKKFDVLDLRSFFKEEITGYNSPIHNPSQFCFNLKKEKIKESNYLTGVNNG